MSIPNSYTVHMRLVFIPEVRVFAPTKTKAKKMAREWAKEWFAVNFPDCESSYRILGTPTLEQITASPEAGREK